MQDLVTGTAAAGLLGWMGWVSSQLVGIGRRLVKVETKLENGLSETLKEVKRELEDHIDGEEKRLLQAIKRDPRARTRRDDRRRVEHED